MRGDDGRNQVERAVLDFEPNHRLIISDEIDEIVDLL